VKINMPKRTPAQLRKHEADLLGELCAHHGYSFADTLPKDQRSVILLTVRKNGKRLRIFGGVVVKLMVPESGALGKKIIKKRAGGKS
jgi:hypothetical protein